MLAISAAFAVIPDARCGVVEPDRNEEAAGDRPQRSAGALVYSFARLDTKGWFQAAAELPAAVHVRAQRRITRGVRGRRPAGRLLYSFGSRDSPEVPGGR